MPLGWGPPNGADQPWPPARGRVRSPGDRYGQSINGVPNYFWWALFCTLFLFSPAGAVGLVCSIIAKRRAVAGDIERGLRVSRLAKTWCWISLVLGIAAYLLIAVGALHMPTAKT